MGSLGVGIDCTTTRASPAQGQLRLISSQQHTCDPHRAISPVSGARSSWAHHGLDRNRGTRVCPYLHAIIPPCLHASEPL